MVYRTRNIIFEARFLRFMAYRTGNITVGACLFRFMAYISYITRNKYGPYQSSTWTVTIRTDRTDRTSRQHTVPWCHNEMRALHVLRIRTVSNSDGFYGAYDPSTSLSIRTVTIRTDRTDRTNRNTLCSDVIMRCTLRMCSEYGPLATPTVCTERTIRQLLLTVRNSATVLDMTIFCLFSTKNPAFQGAFWKRVKTPTVNCTAKWIWPWTLL